MAIIDTLGLRGPFPTVKRGMLDLLETEGREAFVEFAEHTRDFLITRMKAAEARGFDDLANHWRSQYVLFNTTAKIVLQNA